jgi:hypothetical protein
MAQFGNTFESLLVNLFDDGSSGQSSDGQSSSPTTPTTPA